MRVCKWAQKALPRVCDASAHSSGAVSDRQARPSPPGAASEPHGASRIPDLAQEIGTRMQCARCRRSAVARPPLRPRPPPGAVRARAPHTDERATTVSAVVRVCSELQRPRQPGQPPCPRGA